MVACDRQFRVFITSVHIRKGLEAQEFSQLPKSHETIRKLLNEHGETIRAVIWTTEESWNEIQLYIRQRNPHYPSGRTCLEQQNRRNQLNSSRKLGTTTLSQPYKTKLLTHASTLMDKARLLAAALQHARDWLQALPISAVGLRLSDEAIRIAVGYRLGIKTCEPHTWPCGELAHSRRLHVLACCRSTSRQQRHSEVNDIVWRAIKHAQILA